MPMVPFGNHPQYLEERLGVKIPVMKFSGDVHLSAAEKSTLPLNGLSLPNWFWIVVSGGKYDFTAKMVESSQLSTRD